jgi:putative addiction module antidote
MIKQIRKVGNSNALVLDKPVLELLGLSEGSHVQLTVQDGVLIVAPVHPEPVSQKSFEEVVEQVLERRKSALRRLAQ